MIFEAQSRVVSNWKNAINVSNGLETHKYTALSILAVSVLVVISHSISLLEIQELN